MRSACIFFIIVIAIHVSAAQECPAENCIEANKCEEPVRGVECANKQPCCSIVKSKFRTACRHHGGECMNTCNKSLQRSVTDCPTDQVCCVLV